MVHCSVVAVVAVVVVVMMHVGDVDVVHVHETTFVSWPLVDYGGKGHPCDDWVVNS